MAFEHAIVLGGSITGLLSAAALSSEFGQVTIVDRDELLVDQAGAAESRRGVPQGDQVHHLLALGAQRIDDLLPGLEQELLAEGCEKHDNLAEFAQYALGSWRVRVESDLNLICFTRPLFEWVVRRRVLGLPNVTAVKGVATGLVASDDGTAVVGAKVKGAAGGELLGDLVVDATGRGTRSPNWFEDLGYERPDESHLRVYMGYTCFRVEVPDGVFPEGVTSIACAPTPENNAGAVIWPCGNGQHIVVGVGIMRNYPPTDHEGMLDLADGLATPLVAEVIRASKVVSEPKPYRMAGDQRIRWEDLDRRPEGFIALGDAVGSYNPTYGQGMTMAGVGAVELRSVLRDAGGRIEGLAESFQKRLAPHVDIAWKNALGIDANFEGVEYENLEPPQLPPSEFASAFVSLQSEDPEVALAARRATHWMDNSHVQTESIRTKVAAWNADGRTVSPEASDPRVVSPLVSQN